MSTRPARTVRQSIKTSVYLCLVLCLSIGSIACAADSDYVKDGWYLGTMYIQNSMSGDFDDSSFLYSSTDIYDIPKLDDGSGYGFVLGKRNGSSAFEFGYQLSDHDTSSSFFGMSKASYHVFDINYKKDILARNRCKPYLLFGIGYSRLTIEKSHTDGSSISDETFSGLAFNAGAGVAYYLSPQWALTGGIIYRWNSYGSVSGVSLKDSLSETAFGYMAGVAYTFR